MYNLSGVMVNSLKDSIIRIWTHDGCKKGLLVLENNTLIVEFEQGGKAVGNEENVFYEVKQETFTDSEGIVHCKKINSLKVQLKPLFVAIRFFSKRVSGGYDLFPPSTYGWFKKMMGGSNKALFVVQRIENKMSYLLTVVNPNTSEVYARHSVQSFEIPILKMKTLWEDWSRRLELLDSKDPAKVKRTTLEILDSPPMSWNQINSLASGIHVPILNRGNRMQDVLEQMLHDAYTGDSREEIMAFLARTLQKDFIKTDPVDYLYEIIPLKTFRSLVITHLSFLLDEKPPPRYLEFLNKIALGSITNPAFTLDELVETDITVTLQRKLVEMRLDWREESIGIAKTFSESESVIIKLPSSEPSSKSLQSQRFRWIIYQSGLHLKAHIWTHAIGLVKLVYLGAAYRWPHPHLSFSARLGDVTERPPHLQVMMMPPSAIEKVKRVIPNVMEINWSSRSTNWDLFDKNSISWKIPIGKIGHSLYKKTTLRKVNQEFGSNYSGMPYIPTITETKVMDMITSGLYLGDLGHSGGQEYWGVNDVAAYDVLTKLRCNDIMKIYYELNETGLVSMLTVVQGPLGNVCSLSRAFLKYIPSSYVMIDKDSGVSLILSRIPKETRNHLITLLKDETTSGEVKVRCMIPQAHRSYTLDFYQRILKADGTWDDDVSGLLTQVRSAPKALIDEVIRDMS